MSHPRTAEQWKFALRLSQHRRFGPSILIDSVQTGQNRSSFRIKGNRTEKVSFEQVQTTASGSGRWCIHLRVQFWRQSLDCGMMWYCSGTRVCLSMKRWSGTVSSFLEICPWDWWLLIHATSMIGRRLIFQSSGLCAFDAVWRHHVQLLLGYGR